MRQTQSVLIVSIYRILASQIPIFSKIKMRPRWKKSLNLANIDTAEVYDAYGTIRDSKPAGLITIMAAEPFYVTVLTYGVS